MQRWMRPSPKQHVLLFVQIVSKLWIQTFLIKTICWFSQEVFELQISPIPIFASSFQGLSDEQVTFSLRLTQQLTLDKTWFWAIYLTDNKTFLPLRNFETFFDKICSYRYLLCTTKRHFKISSKNGRQSMDSF